MSKTPPTPVPRAQPPAPVARTAPAPAARAAPAPVARSAPPAPAAAGGGATNSSSSSSTTTTGRAMPTPPPRSAAAAGGGAPPSRAAPATSSSSSSASTASTAHKPHAAPAPVASNHTHSVSSSSSTATATGPRNTTGWLCTVEQLPDGTQLRPSRFIDAAKKGQDDLLQEFHDDPEKTIDVNKIDPIYQTALHWAARGGHYSTGSYGVRCCFCVRFVLSLAVFNAICLARASTA